MFDDFCECVKRSGATRVKQFDALRDISTADTLLLDAFLRIFGALFPASQRTIATRLVDAGRPKLRVEFVKSSHCFRGAYLRLDCGTCGARNRLVSISSSFVILLSHMLAGASGDVSSFEDIRTLIYRRRPLHETLGAIYPPQSKFGTVLWSGVAWLVWHEVGHILATREDVLEDDRLLELGANQDTLGLFRSETTADRLSWSLLRSSVVPEEVEALSCGVELVLRTLSLLEDPLTMRDNPFSDVEFPGNFDKRLPFSARHRALALARANAIGPRLSDVAPESTDFRRSIFGGWDTLIARLVF